MKEGVQEKATKAEVEEYNTLAKKFNNMPSENLWANIEEIQLVKFLYQKMTVQQRKNAEPFPVIGVIKIPDINIRDVPKNIQPPPIPPVPPAAPNLLKLIEEVAEKGATFYMDDKEITIEEAYKIAQSKKFNSVSTTVCDNQKPILNFSKNSVPAHNDLKLAKEVEENGGEFYLNDKKISFNEFKNKLEQIRTNNQGYNINLEKSDNGKDRLRITIQK